MDSKQTPRPSRRRFLKASIAGGATLLGGLAEGSTLDPSRRPGRSFAETGGYGQRSAFVKDTRLKLSHFDLRALVTVEVDAAVELSIDTEASVRTTGVLGDQFIALEPGAEDEILVDGDSYAVIRQRETYDDLIRGEVTG